MCACQYSGGHVTWRTATPRAAALHHLQLRQLSHVTNVAHDPPYAVPLIATMIQGSCLPRINCRASGSLSVIEDGRRRDPPTLPDSSLTQFHTWVPDPMTSARSCPKFASNQTSAHSKGLKDLHAVLQVPSSMCRLGSHAGVHVSQHPAARYCKLPIHNTVYHIAGASSCGLSTCETRVPYQGHIGPVKPNLRSKGCMEHWCCR